MNIFRNRGRITRRLCLAAAACTAAGMTITACAATQIFNPAGLQPDDLVRVTTICQTVLGLSPREPLSGGNWMGDDRLDYWSSYYRGCVTSLSDSVQNRADARATRQAETDCRARAPTDSPELALCVLQESRRLRSVPSQAAAAPAANVPAASGPFLSASAREARRREELACATLGLDPADGGFASCIKDLRSTFFALDHPIT